MTSKLTATFASPSEGGFAKNAIWLYCCRAVAGIGGGGINSLSMIIVSDVVAMKDRGAAQGLLGIAISLGSGLGPFVGGLFAQNVTWRWTFCRSLLPPLALLLPERSGRFQPKITPVLEHRADLVTSAGITPPMGAITMVIIWFLLPLNPVKGDLLSKVRQMDWTGTVLSLAMTVCLLVSALGASLELSELTSVTTGASLWRWNHLRVGFAHRNRSLRRQLRRRSRLHHRRGPLCFSPTSPWSHVRLDSYPSNI